MVGAQAKFGIKPSIDELDLTKPGTISNSIERIRPDAILHLAAFTDMLLCEQNPGLAYLINVVGTYYLAKISFEKKLPIIYLSTGAVFDGQKKEPYNEDDRPMPINAYGVSKWLGELAVKNVNPDSLVVRTGWLFGGGMGIDKKFVKSCFEKFKQGEILTATSDRQGSPTYTVDLLAAIEQLIKKRARGVVHVVNDGAVSYFDIAKAVKEYGGFDSEIKPVKAAEVESPELKRGKMEALMSNKLKLRPWREALREYVQRLFDETQGTD